MRSCMYCGKTLEKNEKCTCPQSVRARDVKNTKKKENKNNDSDNVYTTGYTKREKKKFKWRKSNKASSNIMLAIKNFIRNPINGMDNPAYLNPMQCMLLILIESFIVSVSIQFALFRAANKMFDVFSNGIAGLVIREHNIADFFVLTGIGMLAIIICIFMFMGVFWLINQLIIKRKKGFFDFSQRLIYAMLFFTAFSAAGMVVGVFTVYANFIFNILGVFAWIILSYEALKKEWSYLGTTTVLYMMLAGTFMLLLVLLNVFIM